MALRNIFDLLNTIRNNWFNMHLKSGKRIYIIIYLIIGSRCVLAADFYVSVTGDDVSGHGSLNSPWKTIRHALQNISSDQDHVIKISAGKFIEDGPLELP